MDVEEQGEDTGHIEHEDGTSPFFLFVVRPPHSIVLMYSVVEVEGGRGLDRRDGDGETEKHVR